MQAKYSVTSLTRQFLIAALVAGALLVAVAVPASQAMSFAEVGQVAPEEIEERDSSNPSLIRDQVQFLEDNWHLDAGVLLTEDETDTGVSEAQIIRDNVSFLEDNWHLDAGVLMAEDETETGVSEAQIIRDNVSFLEDNWHLDAGTVFGGEATGGNPSEAQESDLWLLEEPRMQQYHR